MEYSKELLKNTTTADLYAMLQQTRGSYEQLNNKIDYQEEPSEKNKIELQKHEFILKTIQKELNKRILSLFTF